MQTISIIVKGKVQGVFYRQSSKEKATALGITGTVRNLADKSVQITATGEKEQLDKLLAWCRVGPPKAIVSGVEVMEEVLHTFPDFRVER